VTDLTHDAADDGFHEIQLSGKQLVFLFIVTTVVSVVIFLCGVLVGRGVRAETATDTIGATVSTPAPAQEQPAAQANPTPVDPPAPAAEAELTYRKRLESEGTPAEDQLKAAPATATTAQPVGETAKSPSTAASAAGPDVSAKVARPGVWIVQVGALRDRAAAAAIVQRLSNKGYPAFLVNPKAGSPAPVYRVQIGRYPNRQEAEQVKRRLEKEEKFNSWISR
jgi:cell division septation protein DedD